MAAQFLAGYSVNGMKAWKAEDGESVSKIAKRKQKNHFPKIKQKPFHLLGAMSYARKI